MPRILFTVTNDLSYDQRMHRIAGTLAQQGHTVTLIGRELTTSIKLPVKNFQQKRLRCFFNKGLAFYAEYNFRLCCYLLFQQADIICAIDLDTILPVYLVTAFKKQQRVYDAHEIFTEQKEVLSRPGVLRFWLAVEKFAVPRFPLGYTVNESIRAEMEKRYGVRYAVVRNLPHLSPLPETIPQAEKWILYQGAVNEGRCFETLIPAMKEVNARLLICGKGNFYDQTLELIKQYGVTDKVELRGYVTPEELLTLTPTAHIGLTLFESKGMNQYFSLANRFFDYVMAGIPQVCVNYPEYAAINQRFNIAYLIGDTESKTIAAALNNLLSDDVLYEQLRKNCLFARNKLNWEKEEQLLIGFYKEIT